MDTFKVIALISLFLTGSKSVWGQRNYIIQGQVTDTAGSAIPGGIITLFKIEQDTSAIAFTSTTEQGQYSLPFTSDKDAFLKLTLSTLGYQSASFYFRTSDTMSITRDVIVGGSTTILQEVVVRGKVSPIQSKEDTTTYNAQSFADGSERAVEDLLKKLPGIRISENGDISFKGKKIDKILLEGEEFFARDYKLLSQNMAAELIDKVEAIENHSDTPLLKGLVKSDQTILNLKLKEDRKTTVFGNTNVAYGTSGRYHGRGNVFSLLSKVKFGLVGSANNIGKDPIPELIYNLKGQDDPYSISREESPGQPIIRSQITQLRMPLERYNFNRARLGALNINVSPGKRLKIRSYAYLTRNHLTQTISRSDQYLLDNGTFTILDTQRVSNSPQLNNGHVEVVYSLDSTSQLKYQADYQKRVTPAETIVNTNTPLSSEKLYGQSEENVFSWNHRFNYTSRLSPDHALVLDGNLLQTELPQYNQISSGRYNSIFQWPETINQVEQNVNDRSKDLKVSARWLGAFKQRSGFSFAVTYSNLKHVFFSDLHSHDSVNRYAAGDTMLVNRVVYHKHSWNAEGYYKYLSKRFNFFIGGTAHRLKADYGESVRESAWQQHLVYLAPLLGIGVAPGGNSKLTAVYVRNQTLPNITQLTDGLVLTNYRFFEKGTPVFNRVRTDYVHVAYMHLDAFNQSVSVFNASYHRQASPYIPNLQINDLVAFMVNTPQPGLSNHEYSFDLNLDRYIPFLSSNIKGTAFYSRGTLKSRINSSDIRNNTLATSRFSCKVSTAFDGLFNFNIGSEFSIAQLLEKRLTLGRNTLLKANIGLRAKPTRCWRFYINGEAYAWGNGQYRSIFHFLDGLVQYTPVKSRFGFELTAKNLLNSRSVTDSEINNYLVRQSSYQLLPRYIMLQVDYKF